MLAALAAVLRNRDIRRLELAWAAANVGGMGYVIAVSVFAYEQGGAGAVGLVNFLRLGAGAVAAPFLAVLADRYRRRVVMLSSHALCGTALIGAGVAAATEFPYAAYALVIVFELAHSPFRPAQAALVPSLARRPDELAAANVVASTIESVGLFAGPALAGAVLVISDPGTTMVATGLLFLASSFLILGVSEPTREPAAEDTRGVARVLAGFRTIIRTGPVRLLIGVFALQALAVGILLVLVVPVALDLLDQDDGWVGLLTAALGVGGLLGSAAFVAIAGRAGLAGGVRLGLVLWGLPLVVLAIAPSAPAALAMLAILGAANTVVEVGLFTLLQRGVPDEVLGRVFGVLESVGLGAVGLGSLLAGFLVAGLEPRGALVVTGALLPLLALLTWRVLGAVDEAPPPERVLALLRAIPIFAPLPASTLETLAGRLVPVGADAGAKIVSQGEPGDRFYLVDRGRLHVDVDGTRGEALGSGDFFGEIALLRSTPRTATVTAAEPSALYALERGDFVAAVTGHAESADAADAVVANRLRALRPTAAGR